MLLENGKKKKSEILLEELHNLYNFMAKTRDKKELTRLEKHYNNLEQKILKLEKDGK